MERNSSWNIGTSLPVGTIISDKEMAARLALLQRIPDGSTTVEAVVEINVSYLQQRIDRLEARIEALEKSK